MVPVPIHRDYNNKNRTHSSYVSLQKIPERGRRPSGYRIRSPAAGGASVATRCVDEMRSNLSNVGHPMIFVILEAFGLKVLSKTH